MLRKLVFFALPVFALGLGACAVDATEEDLVEGVEGAESGVEPTAEVQQGLTSVVLNDVNLNFFTPPRTRGDYDFGGHGPRMDINVELEIRNGNELWVGMAIWAVETQSDWTTAEGIRWYHIFTAPSPIQSISPVGVDPGGPEFTHGFTDTGHGLNGYQFPQTIPASRLVWYLGCVGDTSGNEAGSETGCEAILHDITVVY